MFKVIFKTTVFLLSLLLSATAFSGCVDADNNAIPCESIDVQSLRINETPVQKSAQAKSMALQSSQAPENEIEQKNVREILKLRLQQESAVQKKTSTTSPNP